MGSPELSREPCPDRISDDVGGAFAMGALGGTAWHFLVGLRNSPRGCRLSGAAQNARLKAPRTAGSFAVWGGLFSVFDCALVFARRKEDPWNSVLAGAAAGGFLSLRRGLRATATSAVAGGVCLTLIKGVGILLDRVPRPGLEGPNLDSSSGSGEEEKESKGLFGIGGGKKKEKEIDSGSETMPNFEYK